MTNTLAYYGTATITAVKVLQYRPLSNVIKLFFLVIVPGRPFQPSLMFESKAGAYPRVEDLAGVISSFERKGFLSICSGNPY